MEIEQLLQSLQINKENLKKLKTYVDSVYNYVLIIQEFRSRDYSLQEIMEILK
jgi:hypothetical protein